MYYHSVCIATFVYNNCLMSYMQGFISGTCNKYIVYVMFLYYIDPCNFNRATTCNNYLYMHVLVVNSGNYWKSRSKLVIRLINRKL